MTYYPKNEAEKWFRWTVTRSRKGNKKLRKKQLQCGIWYSNDHYQCRHVDYRQKILARIHRREMQE